MYHLVFQNYAIVQKRAKRLNFTNFCGALSPIVTLIPQVTDLRAYFF